MKKYKPTSIFGLESLVINEDIKLSDIDTSEITNMRFLFFNSTRKDFTGIEDWDVSNVIDMRGMLKNCYDFNKPLDKWDVSNVTDMAYMFDSCIRFNQPLEKWDISKVEDFEYMFNGCISFNQPLYNWAKINKEFAKQYGDRFNKNNQNIR